MFLAILMVCSIASEGDCIKFVDNRGFHLTRETCINRVNEMIEDLTPLLPDEAQMFSYKCESEFGERS